MTLQFPPQTYVARPSEDLALGMRLSMAQGRELQPTDVFRVFNAAKLKAVLVGGHAVNARTGEPRATVDIDVIAERPKKAAEAIHSAFPDLIAKDHPVVTRFSDQQHEAIDIIKPESSPLFKLALAASEALQFQDVTIRIPTAAAMLALKFGSMISPTRSIEDKYIDGRDFILIAKIAGKLNDAELEKLGDAVYTGGGKELLKHIADARAGKRLEI